MLLFAGVHYLNCFTESVIFFLWLSIIITLGIVVVRDVWGAKGSFHFVIKVELNCKGTSAHLAFNFIFEKNLIYCHVFALKAHYVQ